jgi:hypothetical protein
MSLLQVVQDVCAVVGVMVPTSVFSAINANRTMQEMLRNANEMAQRIAYDGREWTQLKKQATFVGDGVASAFNMPADYKRMLLSSNVWRSTSTQQPMRFVSDTDEWFQRRAANDSDAWGEWTLLGDQIHIWPIMGVGVTATFPYIDRNCIALTSGGNGDRFLADTDTYRLDERVLKLGIIWQWKANKGSPYAEDMGSFEDALQRAQAINKPSPIIIDRLPASSYARVGYPWPVTGPAWPFP